MICFVSDTGGLTETGNRIEYEIRHKLKEIIEEVTSTYSFVENREIEYLAITTLSLCFAEYRLGIALNKKNNNKG